ncbi:oligoendopeptidase F [Caryophanon latum]|uniref:Oligopeptidase F n=1 Tax=Caryophanon latum TaxID=33977 RepID=A0A1C0Z2H1_9BACL|nr:oligoendopeptidase F [Caryophanon latum]OCS93644.1 oligoendopeptidase F [Caryophanon latum]
MAKDVLLRQDVPEELTWRLEDIFPTDDAWNEEFEAITALVEQAATYEKRLANSADEFLAVLQYSEEVSSRLQKLYVYAHMRNDEDTTNSTYQALESRANALASKASAALSFITPEIMDMDEAVIEQFVNDNEALAVYRQSLKETLLARPHILPAEQEALMAQLSEVRGASSNTYSVLNNADLTFPVVKDDKGEDFQITHGNFITALESADRTFRERAFKAVYETYGSLKNTFAATLSGKVKGANATARIRNYSSARHAALSNNFIPEEVYDQLVQAINDNLHLLHRYVALRKKVLRVDELHMYDLFAPLVAETEMEYTYDEAKKVMVDSFAPLGKEYQNIVQHGLDNRWVDVLENKGKRSGAYSSGVYGTNPYVLMNWQNNVNNLFTLAHEFGHSMHSYYTRASQPYVYGDYSIFVAEVASTCNEELLFEHLLNTIDDKEKKIYLLNHWLDGFRGTVFRQTMFAEFEHLMHTLDQDGVPLTADKLTEEYYALNKKYYGDDIVVDEEIGFEWARIPHFYYNYYVYQYATGQSAATALSKKILDEGAPAVEKYINNFLKAGCSNFPIDVLKAAGVDMSSPQPIIDACKVFEEKLNELEALLLGE